MAIIRDEGGIEFHIRVQDLPEDEFRVVRFDGTEAISELFEFDLELASENPAVSFDAVVGKPVAVAIRGKVIDGQPQADTFLNGVACRFEQGPIGERFARYYLKLVPRVWSLLNRIDTRVFQQVKAPDIIKEVLSNAGIPSDTVRASLKETYAERDYCVQYQESDWAFVSRLMEEEGIAYFFEHGDDDHVLVLADDASAYASIPDPSNIPFRDPSGQQTGEEAITDFRLSQRMRRGSVLLRDYNFERPQTNLDANSKAETASDLQAFEFPGGYKAASEGARLAKVRLEEQQATRRVAKGVGAVRSFRSGNRFTLEKHRRDDLNQEYLLTRIEHHGYEPQALAGEAPVPAAEKGEPKYKNEFKCIPGDVPFRPARVTPRPYIRGTQSAVVVGPSGEEIYTNEYGCVKVHFHWDRYADADEKSSCWIRVAQAISGGGWGAVCLPRIGQEVLVSFLNGDPDRPYVVGGLYNDNQMPPYDLPDSKTISMFKSASSPGADGFNEIRFEDNKGEEQIFIHGEKNFDARIKNDRFEFIGNDAHLIVKKDQAISIEHERHTRIGADDIEEIGKDRHLKVKGKQAIEIGDSRSLTVKGDVIEVFKANHSEQVTQNYYVKAMGLVIEGLSGITLKCGGSSVVLDPSGVTLKGAIVTVDGAMVKIASGPGSPPKAGSAGSAVSPIAPMEVQEADEADPGKMLEAKANQRKAGTGKYGAQPIKVFKPESESDSEEKTWVEIKLVDEEGRGVPGEKYEITLPDGQTVAKGTLDANGFARVQGIDPGECKVTFPELDKAAWEPEA